MRVIAGSARRLKLVAPSGNDTRPTQDIIKETLFNMIQNEVPGCVFIDLFAGSGAVGIEALSRGAAKAYFAENQTAAIKCIIQNLKTTHFDDERAIVLRTDVSMALNRIRENEVDIIYMDPPYGTDAYTSVLRILRDMNYVKEHTIVIAECDRDYDFSFALKTGFDVLREKRYKNNKHVFLKRSCPEPEQQ